ncbi:MAG TPA: DnaJ domain-containing protein [Thermoanaerobaculia bacterium]|nr:DnaJ domain-containing protein [Thermoanaerobaculia bacterium]
MIKGTYYEILGVEKSASEVTIRERFRELARQNHPDRYRGDKKADAEVAFQNLTEALNVLTNSARRRQYDTEIQSPGAKGTSDFTQIAKAYVSQGVKAFKEGNYSAAREHFDMAVKHNPQDAKAFHYLAMACTRIPSMMRQGVQAIESAVQREPYNPLFLKDAGMICKRAGLAAKAERYFEQALEWDKDNPDILNALAELRQGKGEVKESGKGILDSLFKKG